jgi:hypothetical protein
MCIRDRLIFLIKPFPIHKEHTGGSVIPGRQYFMSFSGKAGIRTVGIIRKRFAPEEQHPFSIYFPSGIIIPADAVILNGKTIACKYQSAFCRLIGRKGQCDILLAISQLLLTHLQAGGFCCLCPGNHLEKLVAFFAVQLKPCFAEGIPDICSGFLFPFGTGKTALQGIIRQKIYGFLQRILADRSLLRRQWQG